MIFFSQKYFARLSRDVRASVANLSLRNFGEFAMQNFASVARRSRDSLERNHANTSRLSGEKIKLSDIHANVVRHSHECRTTVVRIKIKIHGKVVRHSHECRETVSRYIFKIRPKFANLSHKCPFNETST